MNASHIDYTVHVPRHFQQLVQLSGQLYKGPLGAQLVELISLRVSQLNGCVFCLDMHADALRRAGVAQRKLDTVSAWRESPLFDDRERSALDWAETLNALGHSSVPDTALEALRAQFDEREICELTFAVAAIRAWNTLNVGLRKPLPETPYAAAAA
ncbi:carboxymuconolactone decarboxylase family protein [Marilutibacter chinensis]|uniref:Carboxymuconolactone decarboxylase family protein n=1 Tax=Marilutibacter chinensis TaxID=2912247 RepID=A0ABS9HR64_9GAMM|nr:carboxymuconolactone decarboxylase family protein [Lysobacter chinensis]MCF7220622.1 carboxymuconolactone decarboxylase family protein [Lysobacter chinensis]